MGVAPFFVDFHHFYRFSRFTHFCRDLHFVTIYALFPQFFFGENSHLCNITRFLHVCHHHHHHHVLVFDTNKELGLIAAQAFTKIILLLLRDGH